MQPRKRGNRAGQVRRELIRESPIPSDLVQIDAVPVAFGDGHGVGNPGEGAQGREPTGGTQGRETVLAKYVAN